MGSAGNSLAEVRSPYRGRLAPSPTGYLHVGHARTFWRAWERAQEAGGTLIMRMEDLDAQRSRTVYAEAAYDDLHWLGIFWQEGPREGGAFGPYLQSQRSSFYLKVWRKLLEGGHLFPCHCSRKDLEAALSAPHEGGRGQTPPADEEPVYPGTCRDRRMRLDPGDLEKLRPEGMNWRFRVPDGEVIEFEDASLGTQRFVAGVDYGDFLVWRRDGIPSYQLACVADDAAMGITEVVRGADLLTSTARQILLYRALGIHPPQWFHCELVVDAEGRRLAKRQDALSVRALRDRGRTPAEVLSPELLIKA